MLSLSLVYLSKDGGDKRGSDPHSYRHTNMVVLVIEDGLDTRRQKQRNGGDVAPPQGELAPVVSVVYQDSTGVQTGKYQITVYRNYYCGNKREMN